MPDAAPHLVLPAAALAALTIAMYALQAGAASLAISRGELRAQDTRLPSGAGPEWVERLRRNYMNLCEMPVLFYAALAIELALGRGDALQLALAWGYVGLRVAHTLLHVLVNNVLLRFLLFTASTLVLAALWARLALAAWTGA